jgi:hypothetical protein
MKAREPRLIIAIYLRGDQLKPDHISEVLGLQPSRCQKKGELRAGSKTVISKIGVWTLIAQTDSPSITDHIDELLRTLRAPPMPLDQIDGVEEAYLDIFVALEQEHDQQETVEVMLSKTYTQALNRLGLGLQFTVA